MSPQERAVLIFHTLRYAHKANHDAEELRYIEEHLTAAIEEEKKACAKLCTSASLEKWVQDDPNLNFVQRVTAAVLSSLILSK